MIEKKIPLTTPTLLVHKVVRKGEAPVWTSIDTEETPQEEAYDGIERHSGEDRRKANIKNEKFDNIERRVTNPFGRRKSDRAV